MGVTSTYFTVCSSLIISWGWAERISLHSIWHLDSVQFGRCCVKVFTVLSAKSASWLPHWVLGPISTPWEFSSMWNKNKLGFALIFKNILWTFLVHWSFNMFMYQGPPGPNKGVFTVRSKSLRQRWKSPILSWNWNSSSGLRMKKVALFYQRARWMLMLGVCADTNIGE